MALSHADAHLPVLARRRGTTRRQAGAGARPTPRPSRIAAGLAAVSTLIGAGLAVAAVVATRPLWFGGYVSEAGTGPHAASYRLGIIGLGVGLVLLGVALVSTLPAVTVLLAGGGLLAGLSGSVSCSKGCPLPPYESPTFADLVHAGASILAVGAVVLAMLAIAVQAADPMLRRICVVALCVVVPLLATMGVAMLAVGRGQLTGLLERSVLTLAIGWALTMCARLAWPRHQ
jgi:Protein of unknown function (DUF998)